MSIESELTEAANNAGRGELAALERTMAEQRKELDQCRHKLAIANQSAEHWRERALRAEKDPG